MKKCWVVLETKVTILENVVFKEAFVDEDGKTGKS